MSKPLSFEDTPFYFPKMMNKNKCLLSECNHLFGVQFSRSSHVRLCNPVDCSMPGFAVHHLLLELIQTHVHLILCRPLLLLPPIFPSIRVFSNESLLHIRWPKYWNFNFNISPSNEYSGLTDFQRIARRDKKVFFSNQCKEIEENNRKGKTRDLF